MSNDRLLLDTVFVQALLNVRDQYHQQALTIRSRVRAAQEIWVTSAVLTEVADGLARANRMGTVDFIQQCYKTSNIHVIFVDLSLFTQGMELYQSRRDKEWGLTDCISFAFMKERGLTDAVTADHHFVQAGYRALMLEV